MHHNSIMVELKQGVAMMRSNLTILMVIFLVSLAGCDMGIPGSAKPHLYERIGGQAVIASSMDSFYTILKADTTMQRSFRVIFEDETGTRATRIKDMMALWICKVADGDCFYYGMSMYEAHEYFRITGREFDAMISDLDKALFVNNVALEERSELLAIFNQMKGEIVQ